MESTQTAAEPLHCGLDVDVSADEVSKTVLNLSWFYGKMQPLFADTILFNCTVAIEAKPCFVFSVGIQIRDDSCLTHTVSASCPPPSLTGYLFVVTSLFLLNHSGFFLIVFIVIMQTQMLLWSVKLIVMCISFTVAQSCSKIVFFLH